MGSARLLGEQRSLELRSLKLSAHSPALHDVSTQTKADGFDRARPLFPFPPADSDGVFPRAGPAAVMIEPLKLSTVFTF